MSEIVTEQRLNDLRASLNSILRSAVLTFDEVSKITNQGIYLVYENEQLPYVGKTTRSGRARITEMASNFRSHTFNRKLLSRKLLALGFVFKILTSETRKSLIESGALSALTFKVHQHEVNQYIRNNVRFQFRAVPDKRELISLEHFAIAVLNPEFND